MADLPLVYNFQKALKAHANTPIVVMIHGYGAHENDLYSLKDNLGDKVHFVSLRAPMALGYGGFAWYPIHFDAVGAKTSDTKIAEQSRDLIFQFIEAFQVQEGFQSNPIWLLGFSQGAILSYALALNHPHKFQRIMALSGYVLKEIVPEQYRLQDLQHLDFFMSHGNQDQVIPAEAGRMTAGFLEKLNVQHRYQEYPAGHGINPDNLRDLVDWFRKALESQKKPNS